MIGSDLAQTHLQPSLHMITENYEVKIFKLLPRVFADRSATLGAREIVKSLRRLQPEAFSEAKDNQLTNAIANLVRKEMYKGQLKSCREVGGNGYRLDASFVPDREPPLIAQPGRPPGSSSTVRLHSQYELAEVYARLMENSPGKSADCEVIGRKEIRVAINEKQQRSITVKVENDLKTQIEGLIPEAVFFDCEFSKHRGELVFSQNNDDPGEGNFTPVFAQVIGEFIGHENQTGIKAEEFIEAVRREQKRLGPGTNASGLTVEEQRGLIGELWFLLNVAIPECGAEAAVKAWHGPHGAPIDFWFDGGCVEIKTSLNHLKDIQISSVRQLDTPGVKNLFLAHLRLTDHPGGTAAMTLPEYVEAVEKVLPPHILNTFKDKLTTSQVVDEGKSPSRRYRDNDKRYTDRYYVNPHESLAFYRVPTESSTEEAKEFPRFTQSELNARGIKVSKYSIEIARLGEAEEYSEVIQKLFSAP